MPQRSFRLSDDDLAALVAIAEHLAALDRRAPNQTKALSWSIARALDAVAATDAAAEKMPEDIARELADEAARLRKLSDKWLRATQKAFNRYEFDSTKKVDLAEQNEALVKRNAILEAELEQAKAKPYVPPLDKLEAATTA